MRWEVNEREGFAYMVECPRYQIVKFRLRSKVLYVPVLRHPKREKQQERAKMAAGNWFSPQWLGRGEESSGPARRICENHYRARQ